MNRGTRSIMWALAALLASAILVGCGCGDDDDDNNDDAATDDDAADDDSVDDDNDVSDDDDDNDTADDDDDNDDSTPLNIVIDFEDYALGPLGAPWNIEAASGVSTGTIENVAKAGSGHVLHIFGGTSTADYFISWYAFPAADFDLFVSFDCFYTAGSSGRVDLTQQSGSIEIIARVGLGDMLVVHGETCSSSLTPSTWLNVGFAVNYAQATYDVVLNGAPTDCIALPFQVGGYPLGAVWVSDEANDGLGGDFYLDNLKIVQQ